MFEGQHLSLAPVFRYVPAMSDFPTFFKAEPNRYDKHPDNRRRY
ncbi:hypothetical protein SAMN05428948_2221 [Massilia sp. CF038]|nr:hypothetical protein SAMN05428948_2221 [Massilia sp. CF038]